MKFLKYLPLFILSSCGQTEGSKSVTVSKWFDLKQFVVQANDILPKNASFEKTLKAKGSSETKKGVIADWTSELAVFGQSDINRPAWRDKYQVDTLHLEAANDTAVAHQIRHVAKDKTLRTQLLSIHTNRNNKPIFIEIQNEQNNFFSDSKQHLVWSLQQGYSITAYQKMLFMDATETVLSGHLSN
ncbi:MAG: hypothetical protein RLZZ628_4440 [Bacteroidota bacterium]|jgi:hypothetical protein